MNRLHDYWRSSASYRVRIALNLAGLEWQSVSVDLLAGDQSSPVHLARNPQGLVPVLELDGRSFTQSLAIIEYLNDTRALGLLPKDAAARADVRALAYAIAMEISPICNTRVAKAAVALSEGRVDMAGWMQEWIGPGLAAFEAMLGEGAYCYGDQVTMADLCLVPQMYNARRWEVDLSALPRCVEIDARLNELDAFAKAAPEAVRP